MTTLTLTAGAAPRDRLEQVGLVALVGMVAAAQLSIAVAQILLAVAALCWFVLARARGASGSRRRRFFWPLVGYAALTLLSAGLLARSGRQPDRLQAARRCSCSFPSSTTSRAGRARAPLLTVVITVGAVSAMVGIVQYAILNYDSWAAGRRARCRTG